MSSEPSQAVLKRSIRSLIETASTLEETAGHLLHATAASNGNGAVHGDAPLPFAAAAGELTAAQRLVCERVINVFETGTIQGRYGAISIFADGPHDIRQITYGRAQTTEYGNLRELIRMYVEADGQFSAELSRFVPLIGRTALTDDDQFKGLLRRAGNEDPVMRPTQDVFFDRRYFQPAMAWAQGNGFTRALSALVIYDSFIQSGSILDVIRAQFVEAPPARGGDEQAWIREYVAARHAWMLGHHRPAVRASVYRTRDLGREIARGNWDLSMFPVMANGTPVNDQATAMHTLAAGADADDVPFLGDLQMMDARLAMDVLDEPDQIWGDDAYVPGSAEMAASPASAALTVAGRILEDRRIGLATVHVSGERDQATARQNIVDAAAGRPAQRSSYRGAPGGTVTLDDRMLQGLLALAERHSFAVSEIAGGSHSPNSRHYLGLGVDFNIVDGRRVSAGHPSIESFKTLCRQLGATEVRGPGDRHHDTHLHAAWPRVA